MPIDWDAVKKGSSAAPAGIDWGKVASGSTSLGSAAAGLGSAALDFLSRPGNATEAGLARGFPAAVDVLTSGISPSQHESDRDIIKSRIGAKDLIDKLPAGLPRGIADTVIDTALDPTTYLGGSGLIERGVNALGRQAYIGGAKALTRAPQFLQEAHHVFTPGGRQMAKLKLQLAANEGREGLDKYALIRGIQKGHVQNTAGALGEQLTKLHEDAISGLEPQDVRAIYQAVDKGDIATLPERLKHRAHKIDNVMKSLRHLEGTSTVRSDLSKSPLPYDFIGPKKPEPFTLSPELQKFDTSVRGIQKRSQVRYPYLPHGGAEEFQPEIEDPLQATNELFPAASTESRRSAFFRPLKAKDVNLRSRGEKSHLAEDVEHQGAIINKRLQRGAKAIGAKDAMRALARNFAPAKDVIKRVPEERPDTGEIYRAAVSGLPAEEKRAVNFLMQGASPDAVEKRLNFKPSANLQQRAQSVLDAIKFEPEKVPVATGKKIHRAQDVPGAIQSAFSVKKKPEVDPFWDYLLQGGRAISHGVTAPMFFNPLPHMANVAQTAFLADPVSLLKGAGRYAASAEFVPHVGVREALQKLPGIKQAAESQVRAMEAARKSGAIGVNPEREGLGIGKAISKVPVLGKAYGAGKKAYEASNRVLWGTDEALKATLNDKYVKDFLRQGYTPTMASAKAAQRVGEDMVDYGDLSDFTKAMKHVPILQFATYATKKPGVIARATARHPERVLAATRNNPNFQPDTKKQQGFDVGRPLTSIYRGANDPRRYITGALSPPARDILSALGAHEATYGDPAKKKLGWLKLLLTQTAGSAPGGEDLLTKLGLNYYGK